MAKGFLGHLDQPSLNLAPAAPSGPAPVPNKAGGSQFCLFAGLAVMLIVVLDPGSRTLLGSVTLAILGPILNGLGVVGYVVLTMLICGAIMVTASTLVRFFALDPLAQAAMQKKMQFVNKELRKARTDGNRYKERALMELQPTLMQDQAGVMNKQMKTMIPTSIVAICIFTALFQIVEAYIGSTGHPWISLPWLSRWKLNGRFLFFKGSSWIVIYSILVAPVGIVLNRSLRLYDFSHRLEDARAEAELKADEEAANKKKREERRKKRRERRRRQREGDEDAEEEGEQTLSQRVEESRAGDDDVAGDEDDDDDDAESGVEPVMCPSCGASNLRDFKDGSYKCRECNKLFLK